MLESPRHWCPRCGAELELSEAEDVDVMAECPACGRTFRWAFGRGWIEPQDLPVPHPDTFGSALAFELKTVRAAIRREWRDRGPGWLERGLRDWLSNPRWAGSGLTIQPEDPRAVTILDREGTPVVRAMLDVDDQIQLIPVD